MEPLNIPTRTTDLREVNLSRTLRPETAVPFTGQPLQATDQGAPGIQQPGTLGPGPGLITDPNALDPNITPENTLRDQRLGFGVEAAQVAGPGDFERVSGGDTVGAITQAFQAQLPALMQQFQDESEALAQRTSALGRTGSGLFNRDTGFVGDRSLQAREALLGNLAFQATQGDAQRALQANLGNQGAGLSNQNLQAQIAQANAQRQLQVDLGRQSHLAQLQAREDQLAREAMQDALLQAQLLQAGFGGAPTGAVGQAANTALGAAGQFGANAGQTNNQLGGLASAGIEALLGRGQPTGQPQAPATPEGFILNNDLTGLV